MSKQAKSNIVLLLAAMIWGCAFVAQSVAADDVQPFTFNASRYLLGGLFLIVLMPLLDKFRHKEKQETKLSKKLIIAGVACGTVLAIASNLQQFGLQYTSAGKAGFITALYVVLVPIVQLFMGKKNSLNIWIAMGIAVIALYLLSGLDGFSIGSGDFFVLLCAFCYTAHILVIDHFVDDVDGVRMSCIQFFTAAFISAIGMLLTEQPNLESIKNAWLPIAYTGIMSSGVAYTFQIIGQKDAEPFVASVIMSLESVFAALFGFIVLRQALSTKELIGCALMFVAVIISQLDLLKENKTNETSL